MNELLIPYALDAKGAIVHVSDVPRGRGYLCYCPGCQAPLVARKGDVRQHHFAHIPPLGPCDSDNVLHETAKAIIERGFSRAVDTQGEYHLGYLCEECHEQISKNAAETGASIATEATIVEHTRSDLVITTDSDKKVIIEVVVSHDLEPSTREAYLNSEIPILKIRPTWETLGQLESGAIAVDKLNFPRLCKTCRAKEERREAQRKVEEERREGQRKAGEKEHRLREEEAVALRQSYLKAALDRLKVLEQRHPSSPDKLPFQPWIHDHSGAPMYPRIRKQVYISAIILAELGFTQAKEKPWLFHFSLPERQAVFASFGSAISPPIWKYPGVSIFHKPHKCTCGDCHDCLLSANPENAQQQIVDRVKAMAWTAGVILLDDLPGYDTGEGGHPGKAFPAGVVNQQVLSKLLSMADQLDRKDKESRQAQEEEAALARAEVAARAKAAKDAKREELSREWSELNERLRDSKRRRAGNDTSQLP